MYPFICSSQQIVLPFYSFSWKKRAENKHGKTGKLLIMLLLTNILLLKLLLNFVYLHAETKVSFLYTEFTETTTVEQWWYK